MNAREKTRVESTKRIGAFGISNASDWTPAPGTPANPFQSKVASLFAGLNTVDTGVIARLSMYGTGAISGEGDYHSGTTSKSVLRNALMADLRLINDGAGAIADANKTPQLMDNFRMPHGVSDEVLGQTALVFAEKAGAIEAALIELGMDDDFIQQLQDTVSEFTHAEDDQGEGLGNQVGSGKGLGAVIKEGLTIRKQLNVAMKNLYKHDAAKLGAWMTAQHIERINKKKKPPEGGTPPPANP